MALEFTVAFDEADGEGIVFFGNYFRLAHRALEAFLPTIGIEWHEWFKAPDFGAPLRHVECEYMRPLRPGDRFLADIQVDEIGESSVRFAYVFTSPKGDVLARLKTAHVFVSRPHMKKIEIPKNLHDKLKHQHK